MRLFFVAALMALAAIVWAQMVPADCAVVNLDEVPEASVIEVRDALTDQGYFPKADDSLEALYSPSCA
jgi:hypothetical protein